MSADTVYSIRPANLSLGDYRFVSGFNFTSDYTRSFSTRFWRAANENEEWNLQSSHKTSAWISRAPSFYEDYRSTPKIVTGTMFRFATFAEAYYPNGQLLFRCERKPGESFSQPVIYWDNGKAFDSISVNPVTGQINEYVFDRDSKLFKISMYDKTGFFLKNEYPGSPDPQLRIDGLPVTRSRDEFTYEAQKSELMPGMMLHKKTWDKDTMVTYAYFKNMETEETRSFMYNLYGEPLQTRKRVPLADSLMQNTVDLVFGKFGISAKAIENNKKAGKEKSLGTFISYTPSLGTSDIRIKWNGENYTGSFSFELTSETYAVSEANNQLTVRYPNTAVQSIKSRNKALQLRKADTNYRNPMLELGPDIARNALCNALNDLLLNKTEALVSILQKSPVYTGPGIRRLQGQLVNGLPEGEWQFYSVSGVLVCKIHFKGGIPDGPMETWDVEKRGAKWDPWEYSEYTVIHPRRKTVFKKEVKNYVAGKLHGPDVLLRWNGDTLQYCTYANGVLHGKAFTKGLTFQSSMSYENGKLNGPITYDEIRYSHPEKRSAQVCSIEPFYRIIMKNGKLDGPATFYWSNSQLRSEATFKNGLMVGKYRNFNDEGALKLNGEFTDSSGIVTFYENNEPDYSWRMLSGDSLIIVDKYQRAVALTEEYNLDKSDVGTSITRYASDLRSNGILVRHTKAYFTKYFPNHNIAREGILIGEKTKHGWWNFYDYDGNKLYAIEYKDTVFMVNNSVKLDAMGTYYEYDSKGTLKSKRLVIMETEKYDCSHSDYYAIRQYVTIWDAPDSTDKMNGVIRNYYDNGVIQSEGKVVNGVPDGIWKIYSPDGKLHMVGMYINGQRHGRWLIGDLSSKKYLGEICLDPTTYNAEKEIEYLQNDLDIDLLYYDHGVLQTYGNYSWNRNTYRKTIQWRSTHGGLPSF